MNESHPDPLTDEMENTGVEENRATSFFILLSHPTFLLLLLSLSPSYLLPHASWALFLSPITKGSHVLPLHTSFSPILPFLFLFHVQPSLPRLSSSSFCAVLAVVVTPLMYSGFHFPHFLLSMSPLFVTPAVCCLGRMGVFMSQDCTSPHSLVPQHTSSCLSFLQLVKHVHLSF